jgi:aquaporin related protein
LFKALAGEFLVTTLFLFVVCAVGINLSRSNHAQSEGLVVGALATGFCSVALIYSFADVSGAHFNPAVTFATIVTGKTTVAKGLSYMGVQLFASLIAMMFLSIAYPAFPTSDPNVYESVVSKLVVRPGADTTLWSAFVMEVILTFILVYVIFATAFDTVPSSSVVKHLDADGKEVTEVKKAKLTIYNTSGSSKAGFAPLCIGLTLGFLCFVGGSVSGGAFNPARAFGPALTSWTWEYQWIYWIGDFIGAGLAGLVHQKIFATVHNAPKIA